jgi:hypothetical protein
MFLDSIGNLVVRIAILLLGLDCTSMFSNVSGTATAIRRYIHTRLLWICLFDQPCSWTSAVRKGSVDHCARKLE